jgi:MoaA/NifB/PqqE/SkfB family radical SAM enzyme
LSGGEPFLRDDLPQICAASVEFCKPKIINIPTNGLLPSIIASQTKKILETIGNTELVINLSLDGLHRKHDEIRGVKGNFTRALETYTRLKKLNDEFTHMSLGIHSVVSRMSVSDLLSLYDFVTKLEPDSYITEIAEERSELFNIGTDITPQPEVYANFIDELSSRVKNDYLHSEKRVSKITQAFRLAYYQIAAQQLREKRQVIPCYAGYASCQITPFGDVWACCVLGYDSVMGNLRDNDYDFKKVWFNKQADEIRRNIKAKECACPLANAHYTSLLCSFSGLLRVFRNMLAI